MTVKERLLSVRLYELLNRNPRYAKSIGLNGRLKKKKNCTI